MLFVSMKGAAGNVIVLQPTKTAMTFCDIDLGRWIDVPAFIFSMSISEMATGQAKNRHVDLIYVSCQVLHCCHNLKISTINRG